MDEHLLLRCACGWETRGTVDELVVTAREHGRRLHNMEPTRDQVLAMVVDDRTHDERVDAAAGPPTQVRRSSAASRQGRAVRPSAASPRSGTVPRNGGTTMSTLHEPAEAIGRVTHYFGHLSVAAVSLTEPLVIGDRIHIRGHTTDVVETIASMEVDHRRVERAEPGDDVAINVQDHVREHDLVFREP